MINKNDRIFIAGHNGLVGSAIYKKFKENGYKNLVTVTRKSLDLRDKKVELFFKKKKIKSVILAAAKVGGIHANSSFKSEFIYENLEIQNNIIHTSFLNKVKNLIFLGSSCIYPKYCKQPISEKYLLDGQLEPTNQFYAIAKIAGIKLCQSLNEQYNVNYKSLMPCNIYGPNDNYNLKTSHFFPALIKKIYYAKINKKKSIEIWGTGKPKRELLFVDDLADAVYYFLDKKTNQTLINIGNGKDRSIEEYARFIMKELDYNCKIKFNKKMPDGTPRKILDVSLAKKLGWKSKISLKKGFELTFSSFLNSIK